MIFLILKEDNNSYYLPISESFEGDNEQIYSNEIIMLINSIKYKDTNLSVKNVLEILVKNKIFIFPGLFKLEKLKEYVSKYEKDTFQHDRSLRHGRSMVLKFIREYIGRIDNFISKSENGIYFIGHNFRKDTISLNMKSFFGESEVNDTITIIECENELKHINIEFKIFFLFLILKSQSSELQKEELEMIYSLFGALGIPLDELFYKLFDDEILKNFFGLIVSGIAGANMNFSHKTVYETLKYIYNSSYAIAAFHLAHNIQNAFVNLFLDREEYSRTSLSNIMLCLFHLSEFIKFVPKNIFRNIDMILSDIDNDLLQLAPLMNQEELNEHAAECLKQRLSLELLSNKEIMCDCLSRFVGNLLYLTKQNRSEFLEKFSVHFSRFLASNWLFCQYIVRNPEILLILLSKTSITIY
ncbi:hypothetical protein CWI37_0669p0040 [Hamiltosporidium tvaerminnensis]|uniref:Uncharacterized protein n=1 Tax=Hamiltosporidium tvaerminnensis TaxID=1176355 RepID=A0A4Q9L4V6_9MICR|nr:hypothetical protein CWI37_0669p0040 [Hamiltosporidium tvaerminnensis]